MVPTHCHTTDHPAAPPAPRRTQLSQRADLFVARFFNRADYDLGSAMKGTFTLLPEDGMIKALTRDYEAMQAMIFGAAPTFDDILESIRAIQCIANEE